MKTVAVNGNDINDGSNNNNNGHNNKSNNNNDGYQYK